MLKRRSSRSIVVAIVFLGIVGLSCGPVGTATAPTITISAPATGATVTVGETVQIVSTANASAGIARVELLVNGQVVRTDSPPTENPTSFAVSQPWIPVVVGSETVSVVAYDAKDKASDPATITVNVVKEAAQAEPSSTPESQSGEGTPAPEVTTAAGCTLGAVYVADVTIPDETELAPGSGFVKTWRIRNSGTCDWESGFELVFSDGAQMGAPGSVPVPALAAGAQGDVSVDLVAPADPGTYKGRWRFHAAEGTVFGQSLTVVIVVPGAETPTMTPSPTASLTPSPTWTPTVTPTFGMIFTPVITGVIPIFFRYTEQVHQQISVPAGGFGHGTMSCPSGSIAVSGGFALGGAVDVFVYNQNLNGNGWQVYAQNDTGSAKLLNTYAVCLHGTSGSVAQVYQIGSAAANSTGHATASCPSGSVVTGGGWATNHDHSLHVYNSSRDGNGWQVYVTNRTGTSKNFNVYAICLSGTSATTAQVYAQTNIGANGTGSLTKKCDSGVVTGGGFAGNGDLYIYNSSRMSGSDNGWLTAAKNTAGSNNLLNTYAVCATFH